MVQQTQFNPTALSFMIGSADQDLRHPETDKEQTTIDDLATEATTEQNLIEQIAQDDSMKRGF